jgi:molecular chaperone GrpE
MTERQEPQPPPTAERSAPPPQAPGEAQEPQPPQEPREPQGPAGQPPAETTAETESAPWPGGPVPPSEAPSEAAPERPSGAATDDYTAAIAEVEDRWRRALADLDNLRKRHAKELEHERAAERARVLAAWLPVVDNLERALAHAGADPNAILEGVRAVRDQAVEVLNRFGYPRQEGTGVPFDPTKHEVVGLVDDPDAAPGTVVGVQLPGYGTTERQLRPMAVTVSKPRE